MKLQVADARSVEQLVELVKRGARPKYVFFWGHTPKIPGTIDHCCTSNWFPAPFEADGIRYSSTEHYMMAEKAMERVAQGSNRLLLVAMQHELGTPLFDPYLPLTPGSSYVRCAMRKQTPAERLKRIFGIDMGTRVLGMSDLRYWGGEPPPIARGAAAGG